MPRNNQGRRSAKYLFLGISQYLQENACVAASFLIETAQAFSRE